MLKEAFHQLKHKELSFNVLDDVIDTLRFRGSIFFHSSLSAPWGMSLTALMTPRFHIALEGGFHIGTSDGSVTVKPMDIVMLPDGDMHWIADEPGRKLVPSERAGEACELGQALFQQGETTNRLMCGIVEYEHEISHPITSALPTIFHLSNIHHNDSIWMTVRQIDAEIIRSKRKTNTITDRLTEVLFIQLLNQYANSNEHISGFFAALREPGLNRILQLVHQYPELPWTLDSLGKEAGMSRASLQRKFKAALGISPMTYLTRWRLAKAFQLIKYSSLSFDRIAESIGFSDSRTLRTAFLRQYDTTPSVLRTTVHK